MVIGSYYEYVEMDRREEEPIVVAKPLWLSDSGGSPRKKALLSLL